MPLANNIQKLKRTETNVKGTSLTEASVIFLKNQTQLIADLFNGFLR